MYGPVHAPPDPLPLGPHMQQTWRCCSLKFPAASANRALVVAEHERRLDHVGERRHLCVTEHQLEQQEDTLGSRRVGSERADGGTSRRPRGPDGLFTVRE